jgi:hypothetical protein
MGCGKRIAMDGASCRRSWTRCWIYKAAHLSSKRWPVRVMCTARRYAGRSAHEIAQSSPRVVAGYETHLNGYPKGSYGISVNIRDWPACRDKYRRVVPKVGHPTGQQPSAYSRRGRHSIILLRRRWSNLNPIISRSPRCHNTRLAFLISLAMR